MAYVQSVLDIANILHPAMQKEKDNWQLYNYLIVWKCKLFSS